MGIENIRRYREEASEGIAVILKEIGNVTKVSNKMSIQKNILWILPLRGDIQFISWSKAMIAFI